MARGCFFALRQVHSIGAVAVLPACWQNLIGGRWLPPARVDGLPVCREMKNLHFVGFPALEIAHFVGNLALEIPQFVGIDSLKTVHFVGVMQDRTSEAMVREW